MKQNVKAFWLGISILVLAVYVLQVPNGFIAGIPLVTPISGGVFFSTIVLFMLEAGSKHLFSSNSDEIDRVIGGVELLIGLTSFGFIAEAWKLKHYAPLVACGLGALIYFYLIRKPIVELYKGQ